MICSCKGTFARAIGMAVFSSQVAQHLPMVMYGDCSNIASRTTSYNGIGKCWATLAIDTVAPIAHINMPLQRQLRPIVQHYKKDDIDFYYLIIILTCSSKDLLKLKLFKIKIPKYFFNWKIGFCLRTHRNQATVLLGLKNIMTVHN